MNDSENPYRSPEFACAIGRESLAATKHPSASQLIPFWSAAPLLVLGGLLVAAADPISMIIAMVFGLAAFCMGYGFWSALPFPIRLLALIGWSLLAIAETLSVNSGGAIVMLATGFYEVLSFSMGVWARLRMGRGRIRVLVGFAVGLVIGALICGVIGSIVGAILGVELARRSFGRQVDE